MVTPQVIHQHDATCEKEYCMMPFKIWMKNSY